jgi:serine/threonine protein kinase/WD40 repeat protein
MHERWEDLVRLFHAARECPPPERAAFLDEACNGDLALRHEVESLLGYEAEAGPFLEEPALELAGRWLAEHPGPSLVGQRLGSYEIVSLLGAGGMGVVYRARDVRIDREVAVKVMPEAYARNPDRVRRFHFEARAAGALNHPNVLAIYDVGEHDGAPYLVTELLEGESLASRLRQGPLPVRKAVDVALQVARALAAAHDKRIAHRDLKPGNVFITRQGPVKVLDFGLAKLIGRDVESGSTIESRSSLTANGGILGTPGYMSPEQAGGLPADHRTDIHGLGVILHEMLSGVAPFRRDTVADTLHAILHEDPPELPASLTVPPGLVPIVRHCLEKDPADRFQSARDLAFGLEALNSSESGGAVALRSPRRRLGWLASAALAGLALTAVLALGLLLGRRSASVPLPSAARIQRLTDLPGLEESPALSPDGRFLAFSGSVGGQRQVYVRLIAGGPPLLITSGADACENPRWSPDSSSVICFSPPAPGESQGTLWEVPALGGPPRRIAASLGSADVGLLDGRIAYFRLAGNHTELVTASRSGSDPEVLARLDPAYHLHPRWSPDGRWIAFQSGDGVRFDLFAIPAGGGDPRQLTQDRRLISGLAWLPDSRGILYSSSRGSTMPYLPVFSLWEVRVADGVVRQVTSGEASLLNPDVDLAGSVVASRLHMSSDIWRFPAHGLPAENVRNAVRVTHQTGQVLTPTASPDGAEVAFLSDVGGHANLWVISTASGELRQVTSERDSEVAVGVPIWSTDGRSIVFVSSGERPGFDFGLWLLNPDGSGLRNLVPRGLGAAWSSDGRWVYYVERPNSALKKISVDGGTSIVVRSQRVRNVIGSHGATLYYIIERPLVDGRPEFEIHAATPETGPSRLLARIPSSRVGIWQILNPALSPDGKELALPLTDGFTTNVFALSTSSGAWRQVTDFGQQVTFIARRVSWSADGQSILAAIGEGDADVVRLERAGR